MLNEALTNTCSACHSQTACSWWHCTPVSWQLTMSIKHLASEQRFWVEVVEDKLAEAIAGWRQWRLCTDIAAVVLSICSGKELFCSQVLTCMKQLAPSPRLWFPVLQHEPVYFINLFEMPRYARTLYSMNHKKLGWGGGKKRGGMLENNIQKYTLANWSLVIRECSMVTVGLKHLPLTAESEFNLSS